MSDYKRKGPIKSIANNIYEVMKWVETNEHYSCDSSSVEGDIHDEKTAKGYVILKGHSAQLKIPVKIWRQCSLKSGGDFDARMFRWDFKSWQIPAYLMIP